MPFVTEVPGQLSQLDQADDIPTASQSTLLLQKKKEMAEVQQQLDRKKEEFRMRMQECQEKEMELAGKQEQLKEGVRKFEKFLKENDAKRIRANRKAVEEIKLKELKESEKQERTKELEVQEKKRNELQHELRSKQRYEQFLERVCDSTEQFEDIPEVLKRYETLDAANHDLLSRMDEAQTGAEETSRKLQEEMKKTQTSALIVNSDIAKKQKGLKEMRIELQDAEEQMIRQADDAKEGLMELGEINMAIHNIFSRCENTKTKYKNTGTKVKPPSDGNMGDKELLEHIQTRVTELQDIVASYKHKADAAAQAARAAAATADAAAPLLKESEHQKVDGSQSLSGSATDQSFDPDGSRSKAAQA